jgi:RHS repeat-associated protein
MATKLALVSARLRNNFTLVIVGLTLASAIGPGCGDSHRSEAPAESIVRALAEPNWTTGVNYQVGDLVQFNGIVWECRQAHASTVGREPPGNYALWQRPTPVGSGPTPWTDQTHYLFGSDVSFNGSIWESLTEHVSQPDWKPGAAPTIWRKGLSGPTACANLPDGSLCDDGKACNVDTCQAGVCVGSGQTCGGSIVPTDVAVGTIGGSFGVSSSGTASYTVPLWTPEGRNGMTPNLALSYSSAAGDSFVGQGWNLSGGMSMVNLCGTNTATDERPKPVKEGGRYCLDGQPLVPVTPAPNVEYRTEPDTFTKIVPSNFDSQGPRVFTVYTPDGLIHTYGSPTLNTTLHVQGAAETWLADDTQRKDDTIVRSPTPKTVRQAWLRDTVADRFKNTIWFSYTNPGLMSGIHEPLLDTIEYVDTNGFKSRSIKLGYTPRTDPLGQGIFQVVGLKYGRTKTLTSIDMRVAAPGSTTLKTAKLYKLVQSPSATTHKPRLDTIQECDATGAGGKCKDPTVFTYQPGKENFIGAPIEIRTGQCVGTTIIYQASYSADLNHDGKSDLVFRGFVDGAPSTDPPHWFGRLSQSDASGIAFGSPFDLQLEANNEPGDPVIADFDSDGFPDIAVPSGPSTYAYYRNTRGGSDPFALIPANESGVANKGMQIGDFSGRGKVSILRPNGSGNKWTFATFKTTCPNEGPCTSEQSSFSGALDISFEPNPVAGWSTFGVDVDGDRVPDILSRGGSLTNHLVSVTQQKVPGATPSASDWGATDPTTLLASQQGDLVKYLFLDQNGDGLMDALRLRQGEDVPALIMNTGNGFAAPQRLTNLAGTVGNIALGPGTNHKDITDVGARILDYDGDGKQDILLVDDGSKRDSTATTNVATRTTMVVLVSRGANFEVRPLDGMGGRPLIPVAPFADGLNPPDSNKVHNYRGTLVLDADGDGLPDILASPDPCQGETWHREGSKADLLTSITDGMGKTIDVSYRPMTDPTVYAKTAACDGSITCIYGNAPLVAEHKVDNGAGGKNVYSYSYKGLAIDAVTRSPIGFSSRTIIDSTTNTTTEETFEVSTPDQILDANGDVFLELFGHIGQPKTRVVRTNGFDADGGAFERTTSQSFLYELVSTGSYYVRSAGHKIDVSDSTDIFHGTHIKYTPSFKSEWAPFGLTAGGETETCTDRDANLDCIQPTMDTWVADYDNFPDPTSAGAQPWLIGLKKLEIRCSSIPGDSTPATFGRCKLQKVPGRTTTFTNDPVTGAVSSIDVEPDGPPDQHLKVGYTRNPTNGLVTKVTRSAPGDTTLLPRVDQVAYDAQFVHPTSYTNALNQATTSVVDPALGVSLSVTDPNGVKTTYDYDTFGRMRRVNAPGGGGVTTTYTRDTADPSLIVTKAVVDGGGENRLFANRLGQEVRRETKNLDGTFSFVSSGYNALGLLSSVTRPRKVGASAGSVINFFYDELGRTIGTFRDEEAVDGNGAPVASTLTKTLIAGRATTFTNEAGNESSYTADEFGRVITSEMQNESSQAVVTKYTYGHFGLLDSVRRFDGTGAPANGRLTQLHYDEIGRRKDMTDPDAGKRSTTYNAFGDVRTDTDANLVVTTYTTDLLGRVTKTVTKSDTTTFTWDTADNGIGSLAETTSPTGVKRKFLYDSFGRMYRDTWTIDGKTYQVDYAFDSAGRPSKVTYPDAPNVGRFAVNNVYDPNTGRLSKVQKDGSSTSYWTLSETDVDGSIKTESFGNGLTSSYTMSQVTGRLMGVTTKKSTTTLRSWGYAYLPDGNLQRRSDLVASQHERFEYDRMDRIKRWVDADAQGKALAGGWSVNYTIDDFGSLTKRAFVAGSSTGGTSQTATFTIDPNSHRVTASSLWTGSYTYDANGNQTGRPDGETITYTPFDLPKIITGPRAAQFDYDAFGTRARKVKTGTTTQTVYVAGLYEKRLNGTTKEHVYYVLGPRGVVAQVTRPEGGSEDTKYLHSDNLGSVDGVSTAGGTLTQTKRDPYGNAVSNFNQPKLPTTITASTNPVRLGFTGHEQDDELGMINMRGRMFDPRLGRFLTPDPVVRLPARHGNSLNRYGYVLNNPTRLWDPNGLEPCRADASRDCSTEDTTLPSDSNPGTAINRLYPTNVGFSCAEHNNGEWRCTVYFPTGQDTSDPSSIMTPVSGGSSAGGGGSDTGSAGGTGSGGSGATVPPPTRKLPQDCTPCQMAPGGNSSGSDGNIYFTDQGNGFDRESGVALSGQSVRLGAQVLGGSALLFGAAAGGTVAATQLGWLAPVAPLAGGSGVVLTQAERLKMFYDQLAAAPAARTAQEAVGLLSRTLDAVEDAYSGVARVAEPGLTYAGRMYAPMADKMTQMGSGAIEAITKGQRILFEANGAIQVFSRSTGEVVFQKCGGQ